MGSVDREARIKSLEGWRATHDGGMSMEPRMDLWHNESRLNRIDRCRRFLRGEDMITDHEDNLIILRLSKLMDRKAENDD